jgi:hypothetical protein
MIDVKAIARGVALTGLLLSGGLATGPAYSAPADVELLKEYLGNWRGRGTLTGANTETVVCRLAISEGNQDKINYNGRCTMAGTNISMTGTIAYIEANRRFEAAMTSNVTFTASAIGKRQGDSIIFNLREEQEDEAGNPLTITSTMTLASGKIDVDFSVVFNDTGESLFAEVPFSK